jgi:hypothetical protein
VRRLPLALFLTAAAVAAVLAVTATGAPAVEVTLQVERIYDNACRCYELRFSGTVPSAAAYEYVAVLQQKCGQRGFRAFAGASTRGGGSWEAEPVFGTRPGQDSSTYRARWRGRLSRPLQFRASFAISLTKLGGGRYRVTVRTTDVPQKMKGRVVELQRLSAGQWARVQRARLAAYLGSHSVVFTVGTPGLTLRALVPARSASPCYAATASETWVSAEPSPASGANVIDRTVLCTTASRGGIRQISIEALSALQEGAGAHPPSFNVTTTWVPDGRLASGSTGHVDLNPTRCTQTTTRVPLTAQGLRGGSPGPFGRVFDCETPSRVLVRIRAAFRVPTTLESIRPFGYPMLVAQGEAREALLAIRTPTGKPLALATVSESGKARLLTAPICVEDDNG